jgi:hypothetical protein
VLGVHVLYNALLGRGVLGAIVDAWATHGVANLGPYCFWK